MLSSSRRYRLRALSRSLPVGPCFNVHQVVSSRHDRPAPVSGWSNTRQYSAFSVISRTLLMASRSTMRGLGPVRCEDQIFQFTSNAGHPQLREKLLKILIAKFVDDLARHRVQLCNGLVHQPGSHIDALAIERILARARRIEPKQMNTHVSYVVSLDMLSDSASDPLAEVLFPGGICRCSSIPVPPVIPRASLAPNCFACASAGPGSEHRRGAARPAGGAPPTAGRGPDLEFRPSATAERPAPSPRAKSP